MDDAIKSLKSNGEMGNSLNGDANQERDNDQGQWISFDFIFPLYLFYFYFIYFFFNASYWVYILSASSARQKWPDSSIYIYL